MHVVDTNWNRLDEAILTNANYIFLGVNKNEQIFLCSIRLLSISVLYRVKFFLMIRSLVTITDVIARVFCLNIKAAVIERT